MATPTLQEMLQWPKPNYDDPETLAPSIYAVNCCCIGVMTLFMVGRFWSRTIIVRGALAADDWTMLVAYILCTAIAICHMVETKIGIGLHLYDVKFTQFDIIGRFTLITQTMFAPAAALTKISICLTYLRLFPSKSNRRFNWTMIGVLVGFAISTCLAMGLQCLPIEDLWDVMKSMDKKKCINIMGFFVWVAAMNAFTDLLVYLWPIQYLWAVQMPKGKRIGLIACFGVGVIICIVGLVRIWQVVRFFHSWDQTWNGAIVYLLVTVEISLGVICGCLPGMRPVMSKLLPSVFGNMVTSASKKQHYDSNSNSNKAFGGPRKGLRNLKSMEITKDIELCVQEEKSDGESTEGGMRLDSGYHRHGSEDWIIPNPPSTLPLRK